MSCPLRLTALSFLALITAGCGESARPVSRADSTLRVGAWLATASPEGGLRQLAQLLSLEALVNLNEDGRPRPWLAEGWTISPDRLSLSVKLRPNAKFHDGSPVSAPTISKILQDALPKTMGAAFEDVERISAGSDTQIDIRFRHPSPFLIESLEAYIQKPGDPPFGTGPYVPANSASEMRANRDYYLGPPAIDRIVVNTYPSMRSAWAELLRDHLDMLYEVGLDALDSMKTATNVSVFSFTRHYQYVVILNTGAGALRSQAVRRALNAAIDRNALIEQALGGYGTPSLGPIPPRHWAFRTDLPQFRFDPKLATDLLARKEHGGTGPLRFTCLVPAESSFERMALALKRQLAAVDVDMILEEASADRVLDAMLNNRFEAVLVDAVSGPSIFRPYSWWHSRGVRNRGSFASKTVDAALDHIRHAASDEDYKAGVEEFQRATIEDPPAIFIAWGQKARAVSRRFLVPVEPDNDVISTIRFWRPATEQPVATHN